MMRLVAPEVTLHTPRLALEPMSVAHAAALYRSLQDERLYAFIPQDPPRSLPELEARYRRLSSRLSPAGDEAWLNWALRLRAMGAYVGTVEATVYPAGTTLIAYMCFSPFQRQGYAKEGCQCVLDLLARDYEVRLVAAEIDTRNQASIALVESLGFTQVALHQHADVFKGSSSDEYRYERRFPAMPSA
jgi:ribosomal-protein-alanine N-acetyltransferase